MKTDVTSSQELKSERKKVFWRLYTLPWSICFIFILAIGIGFGFLAYKLQEASTSSKSLTTLTLQGMESHQKSLQVEMQKPDILDYGTGYIEGQKDVQKDAVQKGFGSWEVNDNTLEVSFRWANIPGLHEIQALETNVNERSFLNIEKEKRYESIYELADLLNRNLVVKREVLNGNDNQSVQEGREFPFTSEDLSFAKELGIDLEGEIISEVNEKISLIVRQSNNEISKKELINKLQIEVSRSIRERFDGFETYNKLK